VQAGELPLLSEQVEKGSYMSRIRTSLTKFLRREQKHELGADPAASKEVARLNAEYTGSFSRNAGQELGVLPPRYDGKTFGQ
jgi:hypothetical protein